MQLGSIPIVFPIGSKQLKTRQHPWVVAPVLKGALNKLSKYSLCLKVKDMVSASSIDNSDETRRH
jgi:hypothetical protein